MEALAFYFKSIIKNMSHQRILYAGDTDTAAQIVTGVCYNESTRGLQYRIKCEDFSDLKKCIKIIDSYNDFDAETVINAITPLEDIRQMRTKVNRFGTIQYYIGREYSPVIYIFIDLEDNPVTEAALEDIRKLAKADTATMLNGEIRLFWD